MSKKKNPPKTAVATGDGMAEFNKGQNADAELNDKIQEKVEKATVKRELDKEGMLQERIRLFGEKKAKFGASIYNIASKTKSQHPFFMSALSKKYKTKSKAGSSTDSGMYIFDNFLKFSISSKSKERAKAEYEAGKFFLMDEQSPAYREMVRLFKEAAATDNNRETNTYTCGRNTKRFIAYCAGVAESLKTVRKAGGGSKKKGGGKSSSFISDVSDMDL